MCILGTFFNWNGMKNVVITKLKLRIVYGVSNVFFLCIKCVFVVSYSWILTWILG